MNKIKGKALSLVLSLALVISSFSAIPASAATKTIDGTLGSVVQDEFYLVNGGEGSGLVVAGFGRLVDDNPTMTTKDRHQPVDDVKITAISRKSGDNLVKWYDAADNKGSIDSDTTDGNIDLELRNASVSGEEVISLLYKGTYTDNDDNEYTVRASKDITIRVYNRGEVVLGEKTKDGASDEKGELDSDFAQKTVSHETAYTDGERDTAIGNTDSKDLVALKAVNDGSTPYVTWEAQSTTADPDELDNESSTYDYYLKSTSDSNISLGATDEGETVGNKAAGIDVPGLTVSGTKFTVNKVLSDATGTIVYAYTTDGTTPKLVADENDATADPDGTATVVTSNQFTLATSAEKLTVVGFKDIGESPAHNWVAVTKPLVVKYTYDDGTSTGEFNDGVALTPAALTPSVTVATAGAITVADSTVPLYYYYKIDGAAEWSPVTFTSDTADVNTDIPTLDPGKSYSVRVIVSTANTAATPTPDEIVESGTDKNVVGEVSGTYTKAIADTDGYVTASVKDKASPASFTFTLQATKALRDTQAGLDEDSSTYANDKVYSLSDVKQKAKITKTILVDDSDFNKLGKNKTSTYLYKGTLDNDTENDAKVNVNGYEVKFTVGGDVKVDDKANVAKISGNFTNITVDNSKVDEISSDTVTKVSIGDADVDTIGTKNADVTVDSIDSNVGEITAAKTVLVNNGKVGNITASGSVEVSPDDDEHSVTVGDVASKMITVDSGDSLGVTVGTLKATDDDSEITLSGEDVTVGGIDFDYYAAELKIDGFTGSIPAPKNADTQVEGATISTQQADDKVTVTGDADINGLSIADESQITFDGKVNVGSVDGSGKLIVGLGKLNVTSDASDVQLVLSDASFKVGDVAYTSDHDTIDTDSFENYGFTVTKSEGSKTDSFKIASVEFTGLTIAPATAEIAKGYKQTFKATSYAPGTPIPDGYHVEYTLDGSDSTFEGVDNGDGTYTVSIVGYDTTFASENKATLRAELVDADGATNDDYGAAEVDITALAVPKATYSSDTGKTLNIGGGFTYQFAVTSLDGNVPNFVVAGSSFKTSFVGNSGNTYYYKVTAVGKVGDAAGVYINHEAAPSTVITITNPSDTAAVTVKAGGSYQFRVNGPSQPVFQVAGIGNIALTSKAGSNYYFKVNVPTNLAKGGHGVYNNGVRVAILTVA